MTTISPLLSRIKNQTDTLSLDALARYIPLAKRGKEAQVELTENPELPAETRRKLFREVSAGKDATENLVLLALPLVKTIAHREYNRRQSWNTRVSFDDMIQEGIGGFLRGIESYNIEGNQSSATNYLGQWILSDIRRHVESLEHDFSIPHETIERHRKIRAIRSHLFNKLNRYPTDQEILDHANNGEWQSNTKMGRVVKDPNAVGRQLTLKNLEEEREFASSTGALESLVASNDEENEYYERTSTPLSGEPEALSTDEIENRSASAALTALFEVVFDRMGLGKMQEDIIRQKFGMKPYDSEQSLQDIAQKTRLTKYRINQVLTAFSQEMASPGSIFHQVVVTIPVEELDSMGLGWIPRVVDKQSNVKSTGTPQILTLNMRAMSAKARTRFGAPNRQIGGRFTATFHCVRDDFDFEDSYIMERSIPEIHPCPRCGNSAQKVKA